MDIFLALPVELQTNVLTLIPTADLDRLFQLPQLINCPYQPHHDTYLPIRHQAFYAKHHARNLVMLNHNEFVTFSVKELEYFIENNIQIAPREITFVLFDFTDYNKLISFLYNMFDNYFCHLKKFTRNFLIQLLLRNNVPLENSLLKSLFEPLCSSEFNVNWFTIKYHMGFANGHEKHNEQRMGNELQFNVADLHPGREIAVSNLQLHLFNTSQYLKHFVDENGCFYCQNLQSLDLSFNGLTDSTIKDFHLPPSLEHLNLSNNQLTDIKNSSFPHSQLTNLKTLNLSNNNIMKVGIRDPRNGVGGPFRLEYLNLSGNILSNYREMFQCLFFLGVKHIDLSRNMIDTLSPFPEHMLSINLTGNYISFRASHIMEIFPAALQRLSLSAPVPHEEWFDEFARSLVYNAGLYSLKVLEICGIDREIPFEV